MAWAQSLSFKKNTFYTIVIFRKDFGQNSHPIGNIFQGKGAIDHYNIEIPIPKANRLKTRILFLIRQGDSLDGVKME